MSRVRPWDMPRPGLDLEGFLETRESVRARMVARLGTYRPAGAAAAPLAPLVGKDDDPAVMILDAWATTLDVLYFYQRRLLTEGFVQTAVDDRSLHEMATAVAADVRPAVSAGVLLCFTVSDKHPGPVEVPEGTGVQSVPGSGGGFKRAPSRTDLAEPLIVPMSPPAAAPDTMPQVFETSRALTARAEWNEMRLAAPSDAGAAAVEGDAVGVLVRGGSYGVQAGDALIFVAPGAGGAPGLATVRIVRRIGRARARGCTLFLWSPSAKLSPGVAAIDELQVFTSRSEETLYGCDAPEWSELPLAQRAQYRAMVGGLQAWDEARESFRNVEQPAPPGHPPEGRVPLGRVLCLASGPGDVLLAGLAGGGLVRRTGDDVPWAQAAGLAARADVLSLARDAGGRVYAGTSRGVFRSADHGETWEPLVGGGVSPASTTPPQYAFYRLPATPVRALVVIAGAGGPVVIAGTDDGILRWDPAARVWPTMNLGLPSGAPEGAAAPITGPAIAVRAVAVDPEGTAIYAGTERGLFVHPASGLDSQPWTLCDGTAGFDVSAVGVDARGVIYAGLSDRGGLAVRGSDGKWSRLGGDFADVTVSAIAVADDTPHPAVFIGTDRGVLRTKDGGRSFEHLGGAASDLVATALAVSSAGALVVATPFTGVADANGKDEGWPAWALQRGRIDLSRTTTRIAPGARVALVQDTGDANAEPASLVLEVRGVVTSERDGFGRKRKITTLLVDDVDLSAFDRRRARVLVAGTEIPLFERQVRDPAAMDPPGTVDEHLASDADFADLTRDRGAVAPAGPQALDVDGVIPDLAHRQVVVVGKALRVRASAALVLVTKDGTKVDVVPGDVLDAVTRAEGADGGWRYRLRNRIGDEGDVEAPAGALTLLPAAGDADDVPVVATVKSCERKPPDPGRLPLPRTTITLAAPLDRLLDPSTVTVAGNVVEASHGRTAQPDKEVLGISDGSPNLRFTLRNKPLTWTESGGELTPALEVWVQKQRWRRVESFAGQGEDSLVYVVRTTSEGASVVCFGDGDRGRRPPDKAEIVADYRYGAGVAGNVDAGRITMIRQRPLGLKAVVNPLPAAGGADPEPVRDLRDRAPLTARALDRVVSLRDCEDVAMTSPGIALACATRLVKDRRGVLFVTAATEDGDHRLVPGSAAYRDLLTRLATVEDLEVGSATVVPFDIGVSLSLSPGAQARDVETDVRDALGSAFGFARRKLRQGVAESEVIACLMKVEGVHRVRVTRLSAGDDRRAEGGVLAARDASWDAKEGRVAPAELLLIRDADSGVTVDFEGTT